MSGSVSSTALQFVQENLQEELLSIAVATLIIYDHSLTFDEEIRLIWGRKAASAILFLINRLALVCSSINSYLTPLVNDNTVMYNSFNRSGNGFTLTPHESSCDGLSISATIISIISIGVAAGAEFYRIEQYNKLMDSSSVVAGFRVYAVSNCNWYFTTAALSFGLVPVATNLFLAARTTFGIAFESSLNPSVCVGYVNMSNEVDTALFVVTRGSAIASDIVVLLVTWYFTFATVRLSAKTAGISIWRPSTLAALLLQDGTLYFVALLLLNLADILLFFGNGHYASLSIFIFPVSGMLISRFLLRVRQVAYTTSVDFGPESRAGRPSHMSSAVFAHGTADEHGNSDWSLADGEGEEAVEDDAQHENGIDENEDPSGPSGARVQAFAA